VVVVSAEGQDESLKRRKQGTRREIGRQPKTQLAHPGHALGCDARKARAKKVRPRVPYNALPVLPCRQRVKKSDFHFDLPLELIAQAPLAERSASRLLQLDATGSGLEDRRFADLPDLLCAGDLLVFNDTRVLPARLFGHKDSGGKVEILIERVTGTHEAIAQLGVSKTPKADGRIVLDDGTGVTVLGREGEFFVLRFDTTEPLETLLLRVGRMPLPPWVPAG